MELKSLTLEELITLHEQVYEELDNRRYWEYLDNKGKWVKETKTGPGQGILQSIYDMDEVLEAIDSQCAHLEKYPQLRVYKNIVIDRDIA